MTDVSDSLAEADKLVKQLQLLDNSVQDWILKVARAGTAASGAAASADAVSPFEQSKQYSELARHYGVLRFTMFTVFTTMSGAFLAFPFASAGASFIAVPRQKLITCIVGMIISALFGLSELRIWMLVNWYQGKMYGSDSSTRPNQDVFWKWVVLITMLSPSVATLLFWIAVNFDYVTIPSVPAKP